jgi:hypothetical protein
VVHREVNFGAVVSAIIWGTALRVSDFLNFKSLRYQWDIIRGTSFVPSCSVRT